MTKQYCQLIKKLPHCVEPKYSQPRSQKPATWPYPGRPDPEFRDIQKQQNTQLRNASIKERLSTSFLLHHILEPTKHSTVSEVITNYNCTTIPPYVGPGLVLKN